MKLRNPDKITVLTQDGVLYGTQNGDVTVALEEREQALRLTLTADGTPVKFVKLFWRFTPSEIRKEPVKVLGDCWERGYGDLGWYGIIPHRRLPWTCCVSGGSDAVKDVSGRFTECFGVKVRPGAIVTWQYEQRGLTLTADVRNGGRGVRLGGRTLACCDIKFSEYRCMSAWQAVNRFYKTLCDDAIFPAAPVYGSNNWYYAYGQSNRGQILKDTDLIAELTKGNENRPYMVIDAGWNIGDSSQPWTEGKPEYGDMKTLAQEIAARDVKPGIWVRYLNDEARMMKNVPAEQYLSRDNRYLDPSHPEVLKLVEQDTRRLTEEWGYKLIKHDFSNFDVFGAWGFERAETMTNDGWGFWDETKTSAEIMENLYRVIYESVAPGTTIIACNVAGFLTAGYAHINRAGDDTSGLEWERTRRMGVNTVAFRHMYDGAFYKADCDCVGVMGKFPWSENKKWAYLVSVSGTPLFFSTKPETVTEEEKKDIAQCLKRGSTQTDTAIPLDWMETTCPESWVINGENVNFDWSEE